MKRKVRLLLIVPMALLLLPSASHADPISREKTPEALRPWIDWVLFGHEEERCPFFQGQADQRECAWPSRLDLDLDDHGGRFTQDWLLYRDAWVPLPGGPRTWPQDVRADGRAAVVAGPSPLPTLRLAAGRHTVTGTFAWDVLPPLLQVPTQTGLLGLTVRGRPVPFPGRDEEGSLWLQKQPGAEQEEERLEVTVHRRVEDDIPLILSTRFDLQVSGKSREISLGLALPDRFVPMSLASPLPARLDPDGRLRVQARPGRWTIDLTARHEGPVSSLALPSAGGGPWPAEEVWTFEARPHLRLASVEGVPAVDPQQTTLPEDWKRLPAYLMQPGATMTLVEKRRGDTDPAPDQLTLERTLWLDFHGGGYTVRDAIGGRMERGWRLEMQPPATLGRVAINGQEQFITRLNPDLPAGVEVRQGQVALDADSRIEGRISDIPALGWDHDFTQVSATLNLPPAWRLLHASGVDDVSTTWISSWTLLDLFLVLIGALAIARLWGRRWGAIALVTLALSWIEPGAPHWVWLIVLAAEALRRALPEGRIMKGVRLLHQLALVALVVVALPFLVRQVRSAIYPALEQPWGGGWIAGGMGQAVPPPPPPPPKRAQADQGIEVKEEAEGVLRENVPRAAPESVAKTLRGSRLSYLYAPDPKAVVQTGPGLPDWTWRAVQMSWRGPVKRAQQLHLWLVPPAANRLLTFLRVALVGLLALCLFGLSGPGAPIPLLRRLGLARAVALALLGVAALHSASRPATASEIPPADLLNDLRGRLLAPPECRPNCASSPRLALEVSEDMLRARLEVGAAAATAVPLPGTDQWIPARVFLDGAPAGVVRAPDGRLWLHLAPGGHQILMEGPLPDRDTVQIPLPLKPHQVTVHARGWRVEGLRENGLAEDSLQLVRIRSGGRGATAALEPGTLPPFVRVERTISLGLKWEVETRVVRLTPRGAAVLLEVSLLPGESVTTPEVRVSGGKVLLSLGPKYDEAGWTSVLAQGATVGLRAPDSVPWTEIWRLRAAQVWHVETQGIPQIHQPDSPEARTREWRPWPGESVTIDITRPEGLPGQTLTIDGGSLDLSPGLRATDATLQLSIRSSRGAQHVISLPERAELQSVAINGTAQPIRQEGREVTLPIVPGHQDVTLVWRQDDGMRSFFRTPEVHLGAASVNARAHIAMPVDRWTLFLGGPRLGPAVLFWSLLIVSLPVSVALGRLRITPLRWYHWFLLGLGLTQAPLWVALLIVTWLLALGWRGEKGRATPDLGFDLVQLLLVVATVAALASLFWSIERGLLGLPEMQVSGNGSSSHDLRWYLDRTGDTLPRPWVVSVPLMVYRLAMLAWSLWLAQALLRWLKWGWGCFTVGGLWRPLRRKRVVPPPLPRPGPTTA
jgi:hypothetical protein